MTNIWLYNTLFSAQLLNLRKISSGKFFNFLMATLISFSLTAQQQGHKNKSNENCKGGKGNCVQAIDSIKYDLSSLEKDGLIYMRLEEKLARDVYLTLGKTYNQKMFVNIPESEQRHMDAVKALLDKYEISYPDSDNEIGSFRKSDFKKLFDELVAKGQTSFKDAMLVGKEIEEMDMKDLTEENGTNR